MGIKRPIHSQNIHDRIVKTMIKELEEMWYTIEADYPEYKLPPLIKDVRPDIWAKAWWKKKDIIVEVETCDTLDDHARRQWELFSDFAHKNGYEFWIIVPSECLEDTRKKVDEWKIRVHRIEGK